MSMLISTSLSSETATQYSRVWDDLKNFCVTSLGRPFTVTPESIALYIAHLDLRKLQPSTIQSHLSAISFLSQLNNLPDHTGAFKVEKMMKSLHKRSSTTDSRLPINLALLNNLIINLGNHCDSSYECALYRAMYSLAYYALLRAGECTVSKHVLTTQNVKCIMQAGTCSAIDVTFSSFKNSQYNKAAIPTLKILRRGGDTCPVKIIEHYLTLRPSLDGPIFISSAGVPISPRQFRGKLKTGVSFLSLDTDRFNTHSFRIGRATDMLLEGLSEAQIRAAGRWQSRAFLKYLRPSNIVL